MLGDAIGILCGLAALAAIVAIAPFVCRLLGSSWPEPKPERKPTPQPKREPPIRVYANIEEYARAKLGSEEFERMLRESASTLTACTAFPASYEAPTLESLSALMNKFKPDPFARSPVYEVGDTAFRVNMDMLSEWDRSIYEMRPMFLYGNV